MKYLTFTMPKIMEKRIFEAGSGNSDELNNVKSLRSHFKLNLITLYGII